MELVQDLNGGREGREMRGGALDAVGVSSFRSFESFPHDKMMVSHDKMMRMRERCEHVALLFVRELVLASCCCCRGGY